MAMSSMPDFRPHFGLSSPHAQTILSLYYPSRAPKYRAEQFRLDLDGGDQLVLHEDQPAEWATNQRCVILLHGLGGSYRSGHIARVAEKLTERGVKCFRVDQRGCGAGRFLAKGHTHAGRSADINSAVEFVRTRCPGSPITLIGFSLGGNILLKLLAEYGANLPEQMDSALVVAPPIDLEACTQNIQQGFNRVYDRSFAKTLFRLVNERRQEVVDMLDREFARRPRTIFEFDDVFTAPLNGFSSAAEYYESSSTRHRLNEIQVPTRIIAAKDDPLIPFHVFEDVNHAEAIDFVATEQGGHVGYLGVKGVDADRWWLDWRIVDFVLSRDSESRPSSQ